MTDRKTFEELMERSRKDQENFKKSIPAKVFFNHFDAASLKISNNEEKYFLKNKAFYNTLKIKNKQFDIDKCKKLLWNCWSTENAFSIAIPDDSFYKFALHWHFPQVYYSIYLAMTAFHETQGVANENHEKTIKIFGNSIKNNHYPDCISYYSKGLYKEFNYHGIEHPDSTGFSALAGVKSSEDIELQIKSFLKSTRVQNAENKRKRGEKEFSKRAEFQNKEGELVKSFQKKHWNLIYSTIPETTILNLLYRLRIKANYHDIETFINADLDFKLFHQKLGEILSYLNFIHEAYFCKAVGKELYEDVLEGFGGHIFEDKALARYEIIKSI
jgi:hypothetical protein